MATLLDTWGDKLQAVATGIRVAWEHADDVRLDRVWPAARAALGCCDGEPSIATREGVDARLDEVLAAARLGAAVTVDDADDRLVAAANRWTEPGSLKRKGLVFFLHRNLQKALDGDPDDELAEQDLRVWQWRKKRKARKIEADEVEALMVELGFSEQEADEFTADPKIDPITIIILISAAINIARAIIWIIRWIRERRNDELALHGGGP